MITTSDNLVGYKSVILNISMDSKMALLEHGNSISNSMSWKPQYFLPMQRTRRQGVCWIQLVVVVSCSGGGGGGAGILGQF